MTSVMVPTDGREMSEENCHTGNDVLKGDHVKLEVVSNIKKVVFL